MANSTIIGEAKKKIIKEFIKDNEIVQAIDGSTVSIKTPEKLINTYIFNYHQNPYTLSDVRTFLTIQVHIPRVLEHSEIFVEATVEIWIISHERHMNVDNVPKVTQNRNDYLAELIDKKLNGRNDFGIGKLKLITNIEGSYQENYVYRKLVFEGIDINESLCKDE